MRAGLGTSVAGPGAFVVETTGRQSGLPRRVPLLAKRVGDTIVVSTARAGSQWIRNVEHHPVVDVWVAGRRRRATANVVRLPRGAVAHLRLRPCIPTNPDTTRRRRSMIERVIERWHEYLRGDLPGGLDDLLDDNVVFYSPIVHTPQGARRSPSSTSKLQPRPCRRPNSPTAATADQRFRYTKQVLAGDTAVLEFETSVRGKYVNGVDIIRCNAAGRIVEFRVMVRPLQAVHIVHEQMKTMIETLQQNH